MTKYFLEKRGYNEANYLVIKPCSDSQAKKLKKQKIKIFNTREDAMEEIRRK